MSSVKSLQELSSRDVGKKDKLVVKNFDDEELPPGWKMEVKTRKGSNGKKRDRYYTDPVTGYIFRSLTDVQRYLRTGKLGRLAKKPKTTDKTSVESDEQMMVVSTPTTTDAPPPPPPLMHHSKSELPQRASKRLAGVTIDAPPPPPPPSSPPEPKTLKATRLSGVKIDAPSPPPPPPPEPRTRQAKRQAVMEIDPPPESKTPKATRLDGIQVEPPPPPPPPSSPPAEPKISHQVEAKTRPTVVLAIPKEKNKKAETQKITNNDGIADMAAKPSITQKSLEKVNKSKAGENQESHTVLPPVRQKPPPPPPATVPPAESAIPTSDSHQEFAATNNPSQDSSVNFCLNDFWTDPCIEFAVKTLTGAIPFGDLNKAGNFPSSPLEVPMEELWTDPCIEFAVKTLTGAIPVGKDPGNGIQDYVHHQPEVLSKHKTGNSNKKQLESVGNGGGLQKSGNIGFHQQVNGSNGQCSRSRFF